jgi:hypothetical protein
VHIISLPEWPLEKVEKIGGWEAYLRGKGWRQREKTYFIFDEAQPSYEDASLWNVFFKNLSIYNDQFVIAFASYGSPTSHLTFRGIPIYVNDSQRVALRPIDSGDGLDAVGLLFTQMEFDDLVSKRFSSSEYFFDKSFFDGVFLLTGGHVGAIYNFVAIIVADDVRFYVMSEHIT